MAPACNHHITRRGHKWVGGDNTTRDMMQLLQSSLIRIIFTTAISFKQWNILSLMSSAPQTFICLLYSESEGVLLLQVMLFSYQGVLLHCTVRAIVSEMFVITKITFDHQHSHKRLLYCQIHSSAIRDKSHVSRVMSWACYMSQC